MHQAGKLLREVLRDTLKTFVPQSCAPGVLQLKLLSAKLLFSWQILAIGFQMQTARLPVSLPQVGKYKERGCWVHFQRDWCLYQLFYLPGVSERWFRGQGRSICGYLNTGPIHLWSDTPWGPLVCCIWGALGCSAPVLHDDLNLVSPAKT